MFFSDSLRMIMAIIKTKGIYNTKKHSLDSPWLPHCYLYFLRTNSTNKFCVFLIINTPKKKCL